jgi:hypothetical protein
VKADKEGKPIIEEKCKEIGYPDKQAEIMSFHPFIYGEYTDGKAFVIPLTSSSSVKGEKTLAVGEKKGGGISHMVADELKELSSKKKEILEKAFSVNNSKLQDVKNLKSNVDVARNISKEVEKMTGKEVKNKDFESIKLFKEPINKV